MRKPNISVANQSLAQPKATPPSRHPSPWRGRVLLAALVLAGAFGYLGYLAFQGSALYYLTVAEALDRGPQVAGQRVRINGKLLPESFQREPGSTLAHFVVTDLASGRQLRVAHQGVVPDLFFNEHSQIVAEGRFSADGLFQSDLIIVKCPTKYAARAQAT